MYYDNPKEDNAYKVKNQYMFGNDLLVLPITKPMEKNSLFVKQEIWLPKGEWIEWYSGEILEGDRMITEDFTIDEIPIYAKSGAIIPQQPKMKSSHEKPVNPLILNVFPGDAGSTKIYDDEGNTNNYKTDKFAITTVHFSKKKDKMKLVIEPVDGKFPGMIEARKYEIRLPLTFSPKVVKVNGTKVNYNKNDNQNSWTYDGQKLSTKIFTDEFDVKEKVVIEIKFPKHDQKLLSGKIGQFSKLMRFTKFLAKNNWDKSKYSNDLVVNTAQTGVRITNNPEIIEKELKEFENNYLEVINMIEKCSGEESKYVPYLELLKY